jgi:hypothetical protein
MGSFGLIGEDISKHELILGETSDGKKITVVGKLSYSIYPYASFTRSLIEFQRIFLGVHFLRPEDIKFDIVWVTYSNFDTWVSPHDLQGKFCSKEDEKTISISYQKCDPITVEINDNYQVSIAVKPHGYLPTPQQWGGSIKEKRCIELQSHIEKSFDEYIRLNAILHDFLNFINPNEMLIESIEGIAEAYGDDQYLNSRSIKQQNVRVFYKSPISKMMKPYAKSQPLLFFQELVDSNQLKQYLITWVKITEKFKPVVDLYFGVMYSPEMYTQFQFLGLAQALEAFHRISTGQRKKDYINRAREIYSRYSEIAAVYFKFKDIETFAQKVKDTRNYFSHWSEDSRDKAVEEKDPRPLTRDLQLLLLLCLMTELGIDIDRIKKIFHIDKIGKTHGKDK